MKTQQPATDKRYEDRKNSAVCFRNRKKLEPWMADFTGVMRLEGVQDGNRVWVNVSIRSSRRAEQYVSVSISRKED
jgi:hypothetical protein